jgi:hypothetical protein
MSHACCLYAATLFPNYQLTHLTTQAHHRLRYSTLFPFKVVKEWYSTKFSSLGQGYALQPQPSSLARRTATCWLMVRDCRLNMSLSDPRDVSVKKCFLNDTGFQLFGSPKRLPRAVHVHFRLRFSVATQTIRVPPQTRPKVVEFQCQF